MSELNPQPVFIVGASRSGTALMRSALNAHPDVHIAGETHYFDDLRLRLPDGPRVPLSEPDARCCEDYFLALGHRPYGHHGDPDRGRIARADLRARVAQLGGSGDAYLHAFCSLEAEQAGATRWGEKTPRHIFRIDDILGAFPRARILCMIRDPRAVVASYRDWRNQGGFDFDQDPGHKEALARDHERARRSYHPAIIAFLWRAGAAAAKAAADKHGSERVRLVQYEQVVAQPEAEIAGVAAFLGLSFEPSMLEVPMHNSSYSRFDQRHGISTAPAERWREKLTAPEIAVIEQLSGRLLEAVGYERLSPRVAPLSMSRYWSSLPWAVARAATVNRGRIASLPSYVWLRAKVALRL